MRPPVERRQQVSRFTRWFKSRRKLHAELAGVERLANDLRRALDHEKRHHITALHKLDQERARVGALEAGLPAHVDVGEGHRNCVPLARFVALEHELEQLRTSPRVGGEP